MLTLKLSEFSPNFFVDPDTFRGVLIPNGIDLCMESFET